MHIRIFPGVGLIHQGHSHDGLLGDDYSGVEAMHIRSGAFRSLKNPQGIMVLLLVALFSPFHHSGRVLVW